MGFFSSLFNGLGTILGVLVETVATVVTGIREIFEDHRDRGGATGILAVREAEQRKDRLREVNDEIMGLRNRRMSRGDLSDQDRRRWETLREERDELLGKADRAKEVKAAEKIIESEAVIEKVEVDFDNTHFLQYNAFADILGKKCVCGRPMKLQWGRNVSVPGPADFYWGCTGWYVPQGQGRACQRTQRLQREDYGLMTDTDGQWEAIDHLVNRRGKVLCIQRTGWGKSMVYFVSAKLMRAQGPGCDADHLALAGADAQPDRGGERLHLNALTINSTNRG
jgi:hypothetical protein